MSLRPNVERRCINCFCVYTNKRHYSSLHQCNECRDKYRILKCRIYALLRDCIKQGLIKKATQLKCVDCGANASRYDHRDYHRPLFIEPVCRSCNYKRGNGKWNANIFHPLLHGFEDKRHVTYKRAKK